MWWEWGKLYNLIIMTYIPSNIENDLVTRNLISDKKSRRSWDNRRMCVCLPTDNRIKKWLETDFRRQFDRKDVSRFEATIIYNDEEVTFACVAQTKIILPIIARFMSYNEDGDHYRIYTLDTHDINSFNPTEEYFEDKINELAAEGKW
jgi:hypothetical protein